MSCSFWFPSIVMRRCHSRENDAQNGPGTSLRGERYRRYTTMLPTKTKTATSSCGMPGLEMTCPPMMVEAQGQDSVVWESGRLPSPSGSEGVACFLLTESSRKDFKVESGYFASWLRLRDMDSATRDRQITSRDTPRQHMGTIGLPMLSSHGSTHNVETCLFNHSEAQNCTGSGSWKGTG